MHRNPVLLLHVANIVAAASEPKLVDSSEEDADLSDDEPMLIRRAPRKKNPMPVLPQHQMPPRPPAMQTASEPYGQPNWSWVPGHYVPSQATGTHTWAAGPPPSFGAPWSGQAVVDLAPDSVDRSCRRKRKAEYDLESRQRATAGRKPNRVFVLPGGEVDVTCEGKNAWDEALRELVPKCLDMSVVSWSKHEEHTLQRLRAALDNEFEYIGNPLSIHGFRISVMKYLKAERARLKLWWLKDKGTAPPLHISDAEWANLKAYWSTDSQKIKAQKMTIARRSVRSDGLVGRRGRAAREARLVRVHFMHYMIAVIQYCMQTIRSNCFVLACWQREGRETSPGISDVAETRMASSSRVGQKNVSEFYSRIFNHYAEVEIQ